MATSIQVRESKAVRPDLPALGDKRSGLAPVCPLCGCVESEKAFTENGCTLRVCNTCDLFLIDPYPAVDVQHRQVISGKNPSIEILDCERRYQGERRFYDRHFPLIAEECKGAASLLDVGCGTGHLLERLAARPGLYCAGIELNPSAAEFARRVSSRRIWEVPIEQFRSERKFDVITLINVFSHIPSLDGLFQSLRAALRPGGKVILRTSEMSRSVSRWNQAHWGIPDDLQFLGPRTLEYLCAKYGFVIARHIRTPFEKELFRRSRWEQMGRSRAWNFVKRAGLRIPLVLTALESLYTALLGQRLYVSFIVLTPLSSEKESVSPMTRLAAREQAPETNGGALDPRSPFLVRTIRTRPHLYSAVCRARLLYSRRIAGAEARQLYRRNLRLFRMSVIETQQVESLRTHGYALVPQFFPQELIDGIYTRADALFHDLQIDVNRAYSVQTGRRLSLEGLTYEDLAASEKMIALRDPLIQIPALVKIGFDESILKVAGNFLGCVPPLYRITVVRDFPHTRALHSSNFHKDNDECDSLQIFIYLVDIDDTRGPLVYIPGSNHYDVRSCRPRLSRDLGLPGNDGRLSDEEVERVYPRSTWVTLRTLRGSIAAIHGNGIHKGPAWTRPGDPTNRPRTAIKLDLHGYKSGVARGLRENRMRMTDFDGLSELQRLFAHATLVEEDSRALAQAT